MTSEPSARRAMESADGEPNPWYCSECGQRKPDLTVTILNLMARLNIKTIGEFMDKKYTVARLMREKNIGPSTLRDIVYALLKLERLKGEGP